MSGPASQAREVSVTAASGTTPGQVGGARNRVVGSKATRAKQAKETAIDRDLFDMSDDDEEYVPAAKEQKDAESLLGKRREGLTIRRRGPFDAKGMFERMQEEEREKSRARRETVRTETELDEEGRRERCSSLLAELNTVVVKGNDGLVHFAGKMYKISEEGELVEAQGMQTQAQAFEQLNQLAQKYSLEQQKAQNGELGQWTMDEVEYRQILTEKKQNLKVLVGLLGHRHRNVSALFKSRVDWKRYASTNHIEKQLEQNRKDGFIEKQIFLAETQNRVKKAQQQKS